MTRFLSRRTLVLATAALAAAPMAFAEEAEHAAPAAKPRPRPKAKPKAAKVVPPAAPAHPPVPPVAPEEAMNRLMEGNARYVAYRASSARRDPGRRIEVAAVQHPFACILACADSRVAPELIFDQGLGDLFVARVAGNVVDDALLASIEYSVIHLGATLVMVLGHERCGAVKATVDALAGKPSPEDRDTHIGALADRITPAVRAVPAWSTDKLDAAVTLNATHAAAEIFAGSPVLRARVLSGQLKIVAARYDLDDGIVSPAKA
ncbi:carbonic anhydrase [Phenylobacterium sp.]|jgi:carbonic anhydrase|uniref:carbonic anhydrase n=1 Tax=Phenylobacterium sp. TaxID=1871053 RepID=UPI002F92D541